MPQGTVWSGFPDREGRGCEDKNGEDGGAEFGTRRSLRGCDRRRQVPPDPRLLQDRWSDKTV